MNIICLIEVQVSNELFVNNVLCKILIKFWENIIIEKSYLISKSGYEINYVSFKPKELYSNYMFDMNTLLINFFLVTFVCQIYL